MICLAFETDAGVWEVHEEMDGYEAWLDRFHERLDVSPDWMLEVMFPAFETNLMQLYPPSGEKAA